LRGGTGPDTTTRRLSRCGPIGATTGYQFCRSIVSLSANCPRPDGPAAKRTAIGPGPVCVEATQQRDISGGRRGGSMAGARGIDGAVDRVADTQAGWLPPETARTRVNQAGCGCGPCFRPLPLGPPTRTHRSASIARRDPGGERCRNEGPGSSVSGKRRGGRRRRGWVPRRD